MKVSIIIPVYNVEKYLPQCLDSVVSQTIDDYEILVVNDGSPDNSQAIIDRYQALYPDKLISFVKENGGQGSARNMALELARGDFIGFVDSDDWVDPEMYERMYQAAAGQNADIAVCDMIDHYEDGTEIYHPVSGFQTPFEVTPNACTKLFRRSLIGKLRFPGGLWYEDFEFTTRLLMRTENIACVHQGFYHCHCRDGSTMLNNNAPKNLDMITVLENIRADMETLPDAAKWRPVYEYLVLEHLLLTTINRVAVQNHPEKRRVIAEMRRYVHAQIPHLSQNAAYRKAPKKRRLIMFLNYHGLHAVSRALLHAKSSLKTAS